MGGLLLEDVLLEDRLLEDLSLEDSSAHSLLCQCNFERLPFARRH